MGMESKRRITEGGREPTRVWEARECDAKDMPVVR